MRLALTSAFLLLSAAAALPAQTIGGTLFGLTVTGDLHTIDRTNGATSFVGNLGVSTENLTATTDGTTLLTARITAGQFELYEVDPQTGAAQLQRSIPTSLDVVRGIAAVSPTRLVCSGGCPSPSGCGYGLFSVDLSTNTVSNVVASSNTGSAISYDPYYDYCPTIYSNGAQLRFFHASTLLQAGGSPPIGARTGATDFTVEVISRRNFMVTADGLYTYDSGFGTLTPIGPPFAGGLTFVAIALRHGVQAAVTSRAGTPANPSVFMEPVGERPTVGTTWSPFIDHTGFVPILRTSIDAAIVSFAPLNFPTPFGTLLIDPTLTLTVNAPIPGNPMEIPIPLDYGISGLGLHIQAVTLEVNGTLHFTNALDVTVGSY